MNEKVIVNNNNNGIGCLGFIQIVFIIAKILNLVDWSWLVVLIPTWICIFIILIVFAIAIVAGIIAELDK